MRILQVIETSGPGGAETVFATLSEALQGRGHEIHCAAPDGTWLPDALRARGLARVSFETSGSVDLRLVQQLKTLIQRHSIDVVHAHLFEGALYAALAARLAGVPCVTTLHGQVDVMSTRPSMRVKRWLFSALTHRVVLVSHVLQRELAPMLGVPARRLHVVHNGVPIPPSPMQALPDGARIVAIGNVRRPKNYPLLLRAFAEVRRTHPQATLEIAGQASGDALDAELAAVVTELALHRSVTLHGFVADPAPLLKGARCFVSSSTKEGFSLATIEAMLSGVPVVATRSGGPEEILTDDVTGLLVPVSDVDALASGIRRILDDSVLAHRLAVAAASDARQRFSVDAMVSAYESIYRDVLGASRRGDSRSSETTAS